jgi:uncharacterized lipoprotein YmbA
VRVAHAVLVAIALIESACSIGRPVPTVTTYSIEPPIPAETLKTPNSARLRVARVRVAVPYDRAGLVYRMSAVRYVSDPYHAFIADPAPMLGNRIVEGLAAAGVFRAVDGAESVAPARWVLEANVPELYGDFQAATGDPVAVMSIRFTLIDEGGVHSRVVYERLISQRVPVPSASPEALIRSYGIALADIMRELVNDLSEASL